MSNRLNRCIIFVYFFLIFEQGVITCSTSCSLSEAQPSGTNKENVDEIASQDEVLKRKRVKNI